MAPAKSTARHTYCNVGRCRLRLKGAGCVVAMDSGPVLRAMILPAIAKSGSGTHGRGHPRLHFEPLKQIHLFLWLGIHTRLAAFAIAVVVSADAVFLTQAGHQLREAFA